jgi:sodium transport system permease protein
MSAVWEVFRKELLETLRDRRTLIVMILLPLVLYPLMAVFAAEWLISHEVGRQASRSRVLLAGALDDAAPLREAIARVELVDLVEAPELVVDRARGPALLGDADAIVRVPAGFADALDEGAAMPVGLYWDGASDRSRLARDRVTEALDALEAEVRLTRLAEHGLAPTALQPVLLDDVDLATRSRLGRAEIAKILPFLVVMMVLMGAFYPAIDLTAGEKERGTLEPLLATPAPRRAIVAGKYLTVATIAALTGLLNLVSIAIAALWIAFSAARAAGAELTVAAAAAAVPWGAVGLSLGALGCAALMFSGVMIAVASLARGFKEAQSYLTPVYLVCTLPAMASTLPGTELTFGTALIPVANVSLLLKGAVAGTLAAGPAAVANVVTALLSLLGIAAAARVYHGERLLYAPEQSSGTPPAAAGVGGHISHRSDDPLTPGQSFALFGIVAVLMIFGSPFIPVGGLPGIVLAQLLFIVVPVLVATRRAGRTLRGALALRLPSGRHALGAALLGASAWLVLLLILSIQERIAPAPKELTEQLENLVTAQEDHILWYLFALAIVPAFCEELLCRGALARALVSAAGVRGAVLVSATLFGLLHLSAYRFAPTFLLGILLAATTFATGSIVPGMIIHALNNATVVLLSSGGQEWMEQHGAMAVPLALVALPAGAILVFRKTVPK